MKIEDVLFAIKVFHIVSAIMQENNNWTMWAVVTLFMMLQLTLLFIVIAKSEVLDKSIVALENRVDEIELKMGEYSYGR